jgi:hypothetical protein
MRWSNDQLEFCSDSYDVYYNVTENYKDITKESIEEFNSFLLDFDETDVTEYFVMQNFLKLLEKK